jgi:H+-translocating NAD(P) transhydrogenase subunit alpha
MPVSVGVPHEVTPGERRVALVPEVITRLVKSGVQVLVESGAGKEAYVTDEAFTAAGAKVVPDRRTVVASADILLKVNPPTPEEVGWMRPGAVVVGFMNPTRALDSIAKMRDAKVTAFSMELVPRITRAQSMDALSSQANVAGYESVLIGAEACPRYFPMLTTAAGTVRPAKVLIMGAGVAGLQAIATARRLGAVVEAYDVRREAGEQVRSLGAKFLELQIDAKGTGGYARELTADEKAKQQQLVSQAVADADVVITTANVPGRKAPQLVDAAMVQRMKPGAVLVDLAAESGGNCALTKAGERVEVGGVSILGPLNLPSRLSYHSSQLYAKNLQSFLGLLIAKDGSLTKDFSDEILTASVLVTNGEVRYAPTRDALAGAPK